MKGMLKKGKRMVSKSEVDSLMTVSFRIVTLVAVLLRAILSLVEFMVVSSKFSS